MSRLIICTTGTSVAGRANKSDKSAISDRINEVKTENPDTTDFLKNVSAETNSLLALKVTKDDKISFLHTDTDDGLICAESVASIASKYMNISIELIKVDGLQVDNAETFRREGIPALFSQLNKSVNGRDPKDIILNCTGGFKGVVPYLTLYGLINNYTTVYLFQFSDSLITLPPLPVSFDYDRLKRALPALEKIDKETAITEKDFFNNIDGYQYFERDWFMSLLELIDDNQYTMSPFSLMLWDDLKKNEGIVYLSGNALATYEKSSSVPRYQYNNYISRINNPLWRKGHLHSFHGTDLEVYKMGNTSERVAGFTKGNDFYICELFQHDEYEKKLSQCKKNDYAKGRFEVFTFGADEYIPEDDEAVLRNVVTEKEQLSDSLKNTQNRLKKIQEELLNANVLIEERDKELKNLVENNELLSINNIESFSLFDCIKYKLFNRKTRR